MPIINKKSKTKFVKGELLILSKDFNDLMKIIRKKYKRMEKKNDK